MKWNEINKRQDNWKWRKEQNDSGMKWTVVGTKTPNDIEVIINNENTLRSGMKMSNA